MFTRKSLKNKALRDKLFKPEPILPSEGTDQIFWKIRDICDSYLNFGYPKIPDPDVFIVAIEDEIDKYYQIVEKEVI